MSSSALIPDRVQTVGDTVSDGEIYCMRLNGGIAENKQLQISITNNSGHLICMKLPILNKRSPV